MRLGKRPSENLPKCVKFDSAVKFIRGRQNPRLFDTNGGKIGTHLFKFTGRSCKFNKAEQDENLTQICQILSPLGRLNLNRAEPLSEHFIAKFAPAINRKINRVVVRKMTTRWGSCNSRKGYINLSLNLIEKAPELVEYVVLHELAHLIYPHHQKSFYGFIAALMPDFRSREKRLNKK